MRESREFASAYAESVERRAPAPKAEESVEILSGPAAGKAFGEGTPAFEEGVDKIPRELLKLFESQFGSRPQALVRGALRFVGREEEESAGASSQTEDAETMRELEEEESE